MSNSTLRVKGKAMEHSHLSVIVSSHEDGRPNHLMITQTWFKGTELVDQQSWIAKELTDITANPERGQEIAWAHEVLARALSEFETWRYIKAVQDTDPLRVETQTRNEL